MPLIKKNRYLIEGRLEDIIFLMQISPAGKTFFPVNEIVEQFQKKPLSSPEWIQIINAHPEFFLVKTNASTIEFSLLLRYAKALNGDAAPLRSLEIKNLIDHAITIHDRQMQRANRWTLIIPIFIALVTALANTINIIILNSDSIIKFIQSFYSHGSP